VLSNQTYRLLDNHLSEVFNTFSEALCLIDKQGIVQYFNSAYQNLFGNNDHPNHLFAENFTDDHRVEISNLLKGMFSNHIKEYRFENEFRLKNGKKIWIEFTTALPTALEKQKYLFLIIRNITEKKNIEFQLLRSEERYRSVFDQANDAMFVCYLNYARTLSNFVEVNKMACTTLEYSVEELHNQNPHSVIFNNYEGETVKIIDKIWLEGHAIFDTIQITKMGNKIPAEISAHSIEFNDKPAVLFISRDVSQREEAKKKIKETGERLRNLALHLQNIREEERTMIAREIHDELGQMLTFLKIQINLIGKKLNDDQQVLKEKIESSLKLIDDSINSIQKITEKLRPNVLDELGIAAAIDWQAKDFSERTGIGCICDLSNEEPILDKEKSTAIFRIFQEALTNVARHSNANKVFVNLKEFKENLILEIKDNGKGITQSQINDPKSMGILGMKERAILFGGSLQIKSSMNSGTTVRVELPINSS
jgi:two-component system sensor histidine kinase UhpB